MICPSSRMNGTLWLRASRTARLPLAAGFGHAKARIEEPRIVYAKLTHKRVEGFHLRRMARRNAHRFLRGKNLKPCRDRE